MIYRGYDIKFKDGYYRAYLNGVRTEFTADTEEAVQDMIDRYKRSSAMKEKK